MIKKNTRYSLDVLFVRECLCSILLIVICSAAYSQILAPCPTKLVENPNKPASLRNAADIELQLDRSVRIPRSNQNVNFKLSVTVMVDCNGRASIVQKSKADTKANPVYQLKVGEVVISKGKFLSGLHNGAPVQSNLNLIFLYEQSRWNLVSPQYRFKLDNESKEAKIRQLFVISNIDSAIFYKQAQVINILKGNYKDFEDTFWTQLSARVTTMDYSERMLYNYDSLYSEQEIETVLLFYKLPFWNQYQVVARGVKEYEMDTTWLKANFSMEVLQDAQSFYESPAGIVYLANDKYLNRLMGRLLLEVKEDVLFYFKEQRQPGR